MIIDDLTYLSGVPHEVKEVFFYELSKYSAQQLALYFINGSSGADIIGRISTVILPKDVDHRRDLVHEYLLNLPESFRAEFRTHLDDEVQGEDEAEEIIFV